MKHLNFKDQRNRIKFSKTELVINVKHYFKRNSSLPSYFNEKLNFKKLPLSSSRSRLNNRCLFSYKSNSVYRLFKLSRMFLRKSLSFGNVCGYRKSSW